MPDKRYVRGCGSSCIRCWRNRLKHANPIANRVIREEEPESEDDDTTPLGPPRLFKGAHGYIQWRTIAPGTAFIMDIAIRPQHQRKGLGSKMLQRFIQDCKKKGFRKIELDNCTDHTFFEQNGFRFRQADTDNAMILV
jgi:GNAT superfamily N-acetyltransferase